MSRSGVDLATQLAQDRLVGQPMNILVVEDDKVVRITVSDALEAAGHQVVRASDGAEGLSQLKQHAFDLLLTDVRLPEVDGLNLFRQVRQRQLDCAAILMTAYGQVDDAVTVIKEGATDYITKPFRIEELLFRVERVQEALAFKRAMSGASGEPCCGESEPQIIGESPTILQVRTRIEDAARAGVNVLITGETGTGKELCARALHCKSSRSAKAFVQVNCAAIPAELFEAEIFGHERGAFTGAVRKRGGRMLAADGGTLFLDEIGDLSSEHQAKLLRAIESGAFEPVGSDRSLHADVWFVSATNRELARDVEEGRFRQDLFFRLNVIEVRVPPLRERRWDIPMLASDFLRAAAKRRNIEVPAFSPESMAALLAHDYPGNVRELFHALEHGMALARGGLIEAAHLPASLRDAMPPATTADDRGEIVPLAEAVKRFERSYVKRVLDKMSGKRIDTAKALGISRKSLWMKLKEEKHDE
jgi:DNA-binding NtrC family response regulator